MNDAPTPQTPKVSKPLDPDTLRFLRLRAQKLVATSEFSQFDSEDIEQELVAHLLWRQSLYNQSRSRWSTFLFCVTENKVNSIIRRHHAQKRDSRAQQLPFDDVAPKLCQDRPDYDLSIDLRRALDRLPEAHTDLCVRLLLGESLSHIARTLKVNRSTLYGWMSQIQSHLRDSGIQGGCDA